jgi:hypothetical protein
LPWIVATGITAAALAAAFAFGALSGTSDGTSPGSAPCRAGVAWQQRYSPYGDGTLIGIRQPPEVAIMYGGARIGFPNPAEFAAMGYTSYTALEPKDFDALDSAPRDGMLFHERPSGAGGGRYYYSSAGAVYEVRDQAALTAFGLPPGRAVTIPAQGLDGAPRIPKAGTLLRLKGERRVWIVDGGVRNPAANVCRGARINVLPPDAHVLDEIPKAST